MNKEQLTPEVRKQLSVAYLSNHTDKAPEELKTILGKIKKHDIACRSSIQAINEAQKAANELQHQLTLSTGAIKALVDLATSMLPDDEKAILEWSTRGYDEFQKEMADAEPAVVTRNEVKKVADMSIIHGKTDIIKP